MNTDLKINANDIFKEVTLKIKIYFGTIFVIKKIISLIFIKTAFALLKIASRIGWIKKIDTDMEYNTCTKAI